MDSHVDSASRRKHIESAQCESAHRHVERCPARDRERHATGSRSHRCQVVAGGWDATDTPGPCCWPATPTREFTQQFKRGYKSILGREHRRRLPREPTRCWRVGTNTRTATTPGLSGPYLIRSRRFLPGLFGSLAGPAHRTSMHASGSMTGHIYRTLHSTAVPQCTYFIRRRACSTSDSYLSRCSRARTRNQRRRGSVWPRREWSGNTSARSTVRVGEGPDVTPKPDAVRGQSTPSGSSSPHEADAQRWSSAAARQGRRACSE